MEDIFLKILLIAFSLFIGGIGLFILYHIILDIIETIKNRMAKKYHDEESAHINESLPKSNVTLVPSSHDHLKALQEKDKVIDRKNEIIDQLRAELSDLKYFQKMKSRMDFDEKAQSVMDSLSDKNAELSQENDELKVENFDLELQLVDKNAIINGLLEDGRKTTILGYNAADITCLLEKIYTLENKDSHSEHAAISSSRQEVWGDLKGKHYKTLTPEQQDQVHFPILNPARVYFLPSHSSFHSVYWCYALDNSPTPDKTTLEAAIQQKLKPCSKCVDPQLYEDYVSQQQLQKPSP